MQLKPVNRQERAISRSMAAPVLGLNERDPPDQLGPAEAFDLTNWFPDNDGCVVRPGQTAHATGVGSGLVRTLAEWRGPSGRKLIAGGGGELYDATNAGAATALTTATYGSDEWQTVNFSNHLVGCNGQDAPWYFDGTTVADQAWTATVPAGFNQTNLINVTSFKSRLYYLYQGQSGFLYGPVGAVTGGALEYFDLAQIALEGGVPIAQGTWSTQRGNDLDAFLVTVMDTGEVIVYSGDDPGEATSWFLIGRYVGSEPIGRRCIVNVGGDVIILTNYGAQPVSLLLSGKGADDLVLDQTYGKTVNGIRRKAELQPATDGWSAFITPRADKVFFNYPVGGDRYEQYVLNPTPGAWGIQTDIPAYVWGTLSSKIYFGSTGGRVILNEGTDDLGEQIVARARTGYDYLGERGRRKNLSMARPIIILDGELLGTLGLDVDFSNKTFPANTVTFGKTGNTTPWGSPWGSPWSSGAERSLEWYTATASGRAFSVFLEVRVSAQSVKWQTVDLLGVRGSVR